jgi:polyhydroxyalkanoate synthesis regulator phasin
MGKMTPSDKAANIKYFKQKKNDLEIKAFQLSSAITNATNTKSIEERVRELNITRGRIKVLKERIARLESKNMFNSVYNPDTIYLNQNYKN